MALVFGVLGVQLAAVSQEQPGPVSSEALQERCGPGWPGRAPQANDDVPQKNEAILYQETCH